MLGLRGPVNKEENMFNKVMIVSFIVWDRKIWSELGFERRDGICEMSYSVTAGGHFLILTIDSLLNRFFILLLVCLLPLNLMEAKDLYVPSGGEPSYATIQAAIDRASDGDRILVGPGVYSEHLLFRGADTAIQLSGAGPTTTILEGNGTSSVVTFKGGETKDTIITGFTIRRGGGTNMAGGGVFCKDASPSILGNVIEQNVIQGSGNGLQGFGGGLLLINSNALVSRNVFRSNEAVVGGGIFALQGRPTISGNVIYDNSATRAGGIGVRGNARVWNNTLVRNAAEAGGHVNVIDGRPEILNNIMSHAIRGGGVTFEHSSLTTLAWIAHNNLWANEGSDYVRGGEAVSLRGRWGNLAEDPLWVDLEQADFKLQEGSPCINEGSALGTELDLDFSGAPRLFSARVDMGAHEFTGVINFPPIAEASSSIVISFSGAQVNLDASKSLDPEGGVLTYSWKQVEGEGIELSDPVSATPQFPLPAPGDYVFELIVHDGSSVSQADTVVVHVENLPPLASAGINQSFARIPHQIQMDGSHSIDPEGSRLTYLWEQIAGPVVELESIARPVFIPTEDGSYTFRLTVSDQHESSSTDAVTYHVGLVQPIADAGLTCYTDGRDIYLDGTGSVNPNSNKPLVYAWKQLGTTLFGSPVKIEGEDTATPTLSVLTRPSRLQTLTFELNVSCEERTSTPSIVDVHLVPKSGNRPLALENELFDPAKPTIVSFGGGNCDSGGPLSLGDQWYPYANLISGTFTRDSKSSSTIPTYFGYADQLLVMLSELAPNYNQPIQIIGFSTGNMPAFDVALQFNIFYKDPRYAINRITMLDSACRDFQPNIEELLAASAEGGWFWIDNYYSALGRFREGVYNVEFPTPPAGHDTPSGWYPNSLAFEPKENDTALGGAYFSLAGPGRYHQLNTSNAFYDLGWQATDSRRFLLEDLEILSPATSKAILPAPISPVGPDDGSVIGPEGVLISCEPVERAVRYQVVVGPDPKFVTAVISESFSPPSEKLLVLPYPETFWSVRALDVHGSYAFSPPRLLLRDTDGDRLTDVDEVSDYGSDPAMVDTDQDGRTDFEEAITGTHLLFPNNLSYLYQIAKSNSGLTIQWLGQPGKRYAVESSADLGEASWQLVGTVQAPNNSDGEAPTPLEYDVVGLDGSEGFYRIVLLE